MKKELGIIGLGKMGSGLALQLAEKDWKVVAYNRSREKTDALVGKGVDASYSLQELTEKLESPKIIWLMLTAGEATENMLFGENGIVKLLKPGDTIIEGGNANFKDSQRRSSELEKLGIKFLDAGVSGGPKGAREGACIMIGGNEEKFSELEYLFRDLSIAGGYKFFPGAGAGHFVKMVHNGIEYGMMQAIAEGFNVLKESDYKIDLLKATEIYNHKSVIESRLTMWLEKAYREYGVELSEIASTVGHTGEAEWTVEAAKELGLKVPVIEESLEFRKQSAQNPSYIGKVLSALRNQFGGHSIK